MISLHFEIYHQSSGIYIEDTLLHSFYQKKKYLHLHFQCIPFKSATICVNPCIEYELFHFSNHRKHRLLEGIVAKQRRNDKRLD